MGRGRIKGALAALLFVSLLPRPGLAQGGFDPTACDAFRDVQVAVEPVFAMPRLNLITPLAQLQVLSRGAVQSIPHYDSFTLGLTTYQPLMGLQVPLIVRQEPTGKFCAQVREAKVRIGYDEVVIYVARDFPEGSCPFHEILEHEAKHIEVNRSLLQEYVPAIKVSLESYLRRHGAFIVATPNEASQIIQDQMQVIINEILGRMNEENRRRQRQVDSPEEYARTQTVCNGTIAMYLRDYLRR